MLHVLLIRVLVASSLPLTLWIAELNLDVGGKGELLVRMRHHDSIPGRIDAATLAHHAAGGAPALARGPRRKVEHATDHTRTTALKGRGFEFI